jgi:DNA end-binding protein Ku
MIRQLALHDAKTQGPDAAAATAAPRGRASWSGLLRLSLVAVPIKAYPAVSTSETIRFNQLHADCGQRVRYEKHCPIHGKLDGPSIVRGYEYAPGQYVVVEPSELDRLRPAKDKALQLEQFVQADQIDPALFSGRSLYLFPHSLPAQRPFLVLAEAMRQRGCWAVGRVVLSGNRQLVVIRPVGRLLSMHVLHEPRQLRAASAWDLELGSGAAADEERQLACTLIDSASRPVDWSQFRDDTAEQLTALVEAKIAGQPLTPPTEQPDQVLHLLDALKQSVAAAARTREASTPARKTKRRKSKPRRSA